MKGMIENDICMTRDNVHGNDHKHVLYLMTVKSTFEIAQIVYRYDLVDNVKTKFALVYADILFPGNNFGQKKPNEVFIKNAKVSDLARYLCERT